MNLKKFIIGGLAGGVVNYLLGWLFYGVLFTEQFPSDAEEMNMLFIVLGCMTFAFMYAYIFDQWASIGTLKGGLAAGAILGLFLGLWGNFFMNGQTLDPDYAIMALDVAITVVMGSLTGAAIGVANGMLK